VRSPITRLKVVELKIEGLKMLRRKIEKYMGRIIRIQRVAQLQEGKFDPEDEEELMQAEEKDYFRGDLLVQEVHRDYRKTLGATMAALRKDLASANKTIAILSEEYEKLIAKPSVIRHSRRPKVVRTMDLE
jgi:hypothetical protein